MQTLEQDKGSLFDFEQCVSFKGVCFLLDLPRAPFKESEFYM